MSQPIRDLELSFKRSKELDDLLHYIGTTVYEDTPFSEITPEIFVYGGLEYTDSLLYKTVSAFLNTSIIEKIHDIIGNAFIGMDGIFEKKGRPSMSARLSNYLTAASVEASITISNYVGSDHVLLSILKIDKLEGIINLFKTYGFSYKNALDISKGLHKTIETFDVIINAPDEINLTDIYDNEIKKTPNSNFRVKVTTPENNPSQKKQIPYCTSLNKQATDGKLVDTIGRKDEIAQIFKILGRRKTNNVILVGDSGVGKTQIVHGIASLLATNRVPTFFKGKELWEFNYGEVISGTQFRGMLEERILSMIKALKLNKNGILFIENINNLFSDKHGEEFNTGGQFETMFEDGDVQIICCCDYKGYKTFCDTNPKIAKKIQKVTILPPSDEDCKNIINGTKLKYEIYHNVTFNEEVVNKAMELSTRYVSDKSMPSSAIEILDELGSYTKLNLPPVKEYLFKNEERLKLTSEKNEAIICNNEELIDELDKKIAKLNLEITKLNDNLNNYPTVEATLDDLYTVISEHTSVPVGKVKTDDKKLLSNIENVLKSKIIGQDDAINIVSRAIKRNKVGLSNPNKPLLSAFFVGNSGVGKTLLAKELAKEVFGDEHYLVRFDMSEYSDETSVNKLIGASAGYVGYSEGGLLTEAVKNNKYCVLLIDEIEKANSKVYNLFLQILDDGYATDNTGKKVDFKNTMIIMTSNIGTKEANKHHALGFDGDEELNKKDIIEKELKNKFPPEFINRIDNIVYFNSLNDENLKSIIKLEIGYFEKRLEKIGYNVKYDDDLIDYLFEAVKKDSDYGARPIKRAICDLIENEITDLIIQNDYEKHTFNISIVDGEIKIE